VISLFFGQWNLQNTGLNGALPFADVNAPGAWTNSTGNPGIVIALLDDGAPVGSSRFAQQTFSPIRVKSATRLDDDGNGYVDGHSWLELLP